MDRQEPLDVSTFIQSIKPEYKDRVTVLSSMHGNPGKSRQMGLNLVDTEWVCFWDSDDSPDLENILDKIRSLPQSIKICVGGFTVTDRFQNKTSTNKFNILTPRKNRDTLARSPGLWRFLFRSNYVKKFEFTSFLMAEDQLFIAEILSSGESIQFAENNFYFYNADSLGSLTKNKEAKLNLFEAARYFKSILARSEETNLDILQKMYTKILLSSIKYLPIKRKIASLVELFSFGFKKATRILRS